MPASVVSTPDLERVAQIGWNAVKRANPADADLAPLTTTAGLKSLLDTDAAQDDGYTKKERDRLSNSIQAAIDIGILTDANVAASNTQALLLAVFTTVNSKIDTDQWSGEFWYH